MRGLFAVLLLACNGSGDPPPEPAPNRSCEVVVRHIPEVAALTVEVAGSFSDWTPLAMEGPDAEGVWTLSLGELAPGDYPHKFIYGGKWEETPRGVRTQWLDGVENRNLAVGDCQRPRVHDATVTWPAADALTVEVQFELGATQSPIDAQDLVVTLGHQPAQVSLDDAQGRLTVSAEGLAPGKHSLRVWARDEAGQALEEEVFFLPLWREEEAFSWADGWMYFAIVDRFRDGDADSAPICPPVDGVAPIANVQGGDLLGLTQTLESGYFDELGVTSFWLNPVVSNPGGGWYDRGGTELFTSFHGYWPIETREVEECMGDASGAAEDRLADFIDAAHARGQRVMLDLVLNHVHEDHPWVDEHPDWLNDSCVCGLEGCDWEDRRLDCWFTDYLPDLNYRQHALVNQAVDDVLWWLKTYDVDGFRVDAAKHMDTVILNHLRLRLEAAVSDYGGAEVVLIGETFTGADGHEQIMEYVADDRLHGQFDFPLMWMIRDSFVHGGSLRDLDNAVHTGRQAYGDALMSVFGGNHDIPRLATEMTGGGWGPWANTPDYLAQGGDEVTQQRVIEDMTFVLGFVLTQPGVPLLYYGDEIGLAGDGDPDNRRTMMFAPDLSANQRALLAVSQELGQLRQELKSVRDGDLTTLWVEDELYVYARTEASEMAVIAINKGTESRVLSLPTEEAWRGQSLETAFGPDQPSEGIGETLELTLPPRQLGVYRVSW